MSNPDQLLRNKLDERAVRGNLRKLPKDNDLIDFSSNDYLGLARAEELKSIISDKAGSSSHTVNGSTGSRLLTGNSQFAEDLESTLASIFKSESTLLFNSGYAANTAILSTVPGRGDTVIYDELSHACIKDGARLGLARHLMFRHNDLEDLKRKLDKADGNRFVVVESVYSMDGDQCPMDDMILMGKDYGFSMIVDEAHSTGVFGENGKGLFDDPSIFARIYTFGKGLGAHGACIAGSATLREYLINFARPFIYTTALPHHSLLSIKEGFEYIGRHPELQEKLHSHIDYFVSEVESLGLNRVESRSPIQTLILPGNEDVKAAARELNEQGLDVRPILSPTVKEGTERLRICLHAFNTRDELDQLLNCLRKLK